MKAITPKPINNRVFLNNKKKVNKVASVVFIQQLSNKILAEKLKGLFIQINES